MATLSKTNRVSRVRKASNTAGIALKRLEDLSNSGNPDVAARATAMLVLERTEQDDL